MKVNRTLTDSGYPPQDFEKDDSFEAIFALNMGDFVTEHLISDDLLSKISHSMMGNNPDRLKNQLQELVSIYSLDNTLSLLGFHSKQESVLYDSIAMSLAEMFQVDACQIFQTMHKKEDEYFLSLTGTSVQEVSETRWNIGYEVSDSDSIVAEAYHDDFPMVYPQLSSDTPGWTPLKELHQEQVQSIILVSLYDGQKRLGLMSFETYEPRDFSQEIVDLAEATAKVFMTSLTLQRLLEKAQQLVAEENPNGSEMLSLRAQLTDVIADLGRYQQYFVETLSYAIDARSDFTQGHSQGVAQIARSIAEEMSLNEKTLDLVYYAGLLGSLGKIHVPQEILTKEEALTSEEREALKNSPNIGVGLLMKMNFLAEVIPYVDCQKERWNGEGSPHGLSGRSIPLGSRILAVADAYAALTHPRPYRERPLSSEEALSVIQSEAGTKWDPDVVASLSLIAQASAR